MSDWGKGVINNIGWGQGANNDIGWGSIYDKSNAGETLLSGSGYNANYQAVIDYANSESLTLPNSTIQNLQNDFAISINPFFSKFAELHFFAGEAGKSGFKSIDWARLNKANYYNSPTFLERGVKGNRTSAYIDLNFNAEIETTIDSLTFGFFLPNNYRTGSAYSNMGGSGLNNGGLLFLLSKDGDPFFSSNSDLNSIDDYNFESNPTKNLISLSSDGNIMTLREDENVLTTKSGLTPVQSDVSVYLLARHSTRFGAEEPIQFTDDIISLSFITNEELTSSEIGILSTAIKTYLNAI